MVNNVFIDKCQAHKACSNSKRSIFIKMSLYEIGDLHAGQMFRLLSNLHSRTCWYPPDRIRQSQRALAWWEKDSMRHGRRSPCQTQHLVLVVCDVFFSFRTWRMLLFLAIQMRTYDKFRQWPGK